MAGPDEGEGRDPDLKKALDKAWQDAKNKGNDPGWFDVKKVEVKAENPITEYRVTIKRTGGL